jgi:plasmid replication initiation protein
MKRKKTVKILIKTESKVRKSNVFVNGRYRFGLHEQKILLQIISKVQFDEAEFVPYFLSWADLNAISNGFLNSSKKIDEACEKLKNKTIKIKSGNIEDNFGFLSGWTTTAGQGVHFRIDSGMKKMLLELLQEGNFTLYRLECAMALSSSYAIRLYEVLKSEQWKAQPVVLNLDKLKWSLDIGEKNVTYNDFGSFRVHILEKSKRDFKKYTDITFDYQTIKEGRKVTALEITIRENKTYQRTVQGVSAKKAVETVKPGQIIIIAGKEYEVMDGGIQYRDGALHTGKLNQLILEGKAKIKGSNDGAKKE